MSRGGIVFVDPIELKARMRHFAMTWCSMNCRNARTLDCVNTSPLGCRDARGSSNHGHGLVARSLAPPGRAMLRDDHDRCRPFPYPTIL